MGLEAVIFDMDGVLSDTQKLHAQAQSQILEEYGVECRQRRLPENMLGDHQERFSEKKAQHLTR